MTSPNQAIAATTPREGGNGVVDEQDNLLAIVPRQRCPQGQCAAEQGPTVSLVGQRGWRNHVLTIGGLVALIALAWAGYQAYTTVNDRIARARKEQLRGHDRAADAHPDLRVLVRGHVARLDRRLAGIEQKLDRLLEHSSIRKRGRRR
jgi:uncharacterized membrane protein YebE (DUF533 family)